MTEQQRLAQAAHNLRLFEQIDLGEFADWGATLLFYATLHHVEACLIRVGYPRLGSGRHQERTEAMARSGAIPRLTQRCYAVLQRKSRSARYENWREQGLNEARVKRLHQEELTPLITSLKAID